MTSRYTYGTGYYSLGKAERALEDMLCEGEVSPGEKPKIEPVYTALPNGKRRLVHFEITLESSF